MLRATSRNTLFVTSRHGGGGAYVASASRTVARLDVTEGERARAQARVSVFCDAFRFLRLSVRRMGYVFILHRERGLGCEGEGFSG